MDRQPCGRESRTGKAQSLPARVSSNSNSTAAAAAPSSKRATGRIAPAVTTIHRYSKQGAKMNTLSGYHGRKGSLYSKPRVLRTDDDDDDMPASNRQHHRQRGSTAADDTNTTWLGGVFRDKTGEKLKQAELNVLQQFVSTSCWSQFIGVSNEVEVRTLKFDLGFFRSTPALVLLHGFASGLACWAPCFDALSARCVVYALDLPGFGRSSRSPFDGQDSKAIEYQFVSYLEEWRDAIGLDSFILAGHGFGGYIATLYAMKHPERVRHVVLVEPWGFNELPLGMAEKNRGGKMAAGSHGHGKSQADLCTDKLPFWLRHANSVLNFSDALSLFRTLPGFLSEWLYAKMFMRPLSCPDDSAVLASDYFWNKAESHSYIYLCNKMKGTGETAFGKLNVLYFWSKNPLISRLSDLDPEVPMSFIYGSQSVVDHKTGYEAYHLRPDSFVEVYMVEKASHNVFIDNPKGFTDVVISIVDEIEMEISELENATDIRSRMCSTVDELYWDCEWETLDLGPENPEPLPDIIVEDFSHLRGDREGLDKEEHLYDPDPSSSNHGDPEGADAGDQIPLLQQNYDIDFDYSSSSLSDVEGL